MESLTTSNLSDEDTYGQGEELFGHHGIIYRNTNMPEEEPPCNGSLSVVQYPNGISLEWKPSEVPVLADSSESDWTMVDTVRHRSRTLSGSTEAWRHQQIKIPLSSLKGYKISKDKRKLTLVPRDSNLKHILLFQFGDSGGLTQILCSFITSKRSSFDKNYYVLVHNLSNKGSGKSLPKSFSEFSLQPTHSHSSDRMWDMVTRLADKPVETTLSTFSKFTNYLPTSYGHTEQNMKEEEPLPAILGGGSVEESYAVVGPPRQLPDRGPPLSAAQWAAAADADGRILDPESIKRIIFRGGVQPSLRYDVWKFLLGYYPWDSTHAERLELKKKKVDDYFRMKLQWKSLSPEQEARFSPFRERKNIIEKDVYRTDRSVAFFAGDNNPNLALLSDILMTYVMYNFDLGYVQGMSDLLSPILALMSNEVDAFWCFVGFMDKVYRNFDEDQSGMKKQLAQLYTLLTAAEPRLADHLNRHESGDMFFCFRWLLVWFKREFSHDHIMTLWEILWTGLPCSNFHLLICVAILETEKEILMEKNYGFNEILKHFNELSYRLDVDLLVRKAEGIFLELADMENITVATRRVLGIPGATGIEEQTSSSDEDNPYSPPQTPPPTTPISHTNGSSDFCHEGTVKEENRPTPSNTADDVASSSCTNATSGVASCRAEHSNGSVETSYERGLSLHYN